MSTARTLDPRALVGRRGELRRLGALIDGARAGRGGAVVVEGAPGVGKSALLAAVRPRDLPVLSVTGAETEIDLPFAGLAELLAPVLGRLDALPDVQRAALRGALALDAPAGEDRGLVLHAFAALLRAAAADAPLVLCVDDVQWLDPSSQEAVAFAARRAERLGIAVVVVRSLRGAPAEPWPGVERLTLGDLERADALALARSGGVTAAVAEALVEALGGNPLALTEAPAQLTAAARRPRHPHRPIARGRAPPAGVRGAAGRAAGGHAPRAAAARRQRQRSRRAAGGGPGGRRWARGLRRRRGRRPGHRRAAPAPLRPPARAHGRPAGGGRARPARRAPVPGRRHPRAAARLAPRGGRGRTRRGARRGARSARPRRPGARGTRDRGARLRARGGAEPGARRRDRADAHGRRDGDRRRPARRGQGAARRASARRRGSPGARRRPAPAGHGDAAHRPADGGLCPAGAGGRARPPPRLRPRRRAAHPGRDRARGPRHDGSAGDAGRPRQDPRAARGRPRARDPARRGAGEPGRARACARPAARAGGRARRAGPDRSRSRDPVGRRALPPLDGGLRGCRAAPRLARGHQPLPRRRRRPGVPALGARQPAPAPRIVRRRHGAGRRGRGAGRGRGRELPALGVALHGRLRGRPSR